MKYLLPLSMFSALGAIALHAAQPNIVVILADDMGYGEVQALNSEGKIKTPGLDSVARQGMVFTDAHSGSSVCTPTRYGLMTGRYAWRTRLQKGVIKGGPSLIKDEVLTLPEMLSSKGYDTVMIGKWHLGMKFDGEEKNSKGAVKPGAVVSEGPIDSAGFDEFYGFHYARQMDLWIEGDKVTRNITPVEMLPALTNKAVEYIHSKKDSEKPFFMYIPWNSPHSPVTPSAEWQGKSGINDHADFVMETDHGYGQVLKALKDIGQLENTLVICTSDNGTSPGTSGWKVLEEAGHDPSGGLRGAKADIWDGGHRVPFLVQWPAKIKAGSQSDAVICLTDVLATTAEIVNHPIPDDQAADSFSFLGLLQGEQTNERAAVVHHSVGGLFAIRDENYKLVCCPGSGGWSAPKDHTMLKKNGLDSPMNYQLYDMVVDRAEENNLVTEKPEVAVRLRAELQSLIDEGRSTKGPRLMNDSPIIVDKWKTAPVSKKKKKKKNNK